MADTNGSITLPRWSLWVGGVVSAVFAITFVPWSIWVTNGQFAAASAKDVESLRERMVVVESTRFTASDGRSLMSDLKGELKGDLNEIKAQLGNLQRGFDRTIGRGAVMP
jgi:hypothetical protein